MKPDGSGENKKKKLKAFHVKIWQAWKHFSGTPWLRWHRKDGHFFCFHVLSFTLPKWTFLGGAFKHFFFSPRSLRKWPNLTSICFQMGWGTNHQADFFSSTSEIQAQQQHAMLEEAQEAALKEVSKPQSNGPSMCQGRAQLPMLGINLSHLEKRNYYNGYVNPYYWVDDHPLLFRVYRGWKTTHLYRD